MSHNLETHGQQAAFFSAHESAWHQLGTVTPEALNAADALRMAHLDGWNVRKMPEFTFSETGQRLEVPGRFAILRDNPFRRDQVDVLGSVGNVYHPIQNEEHVALLDALVDESGAHFETAGSLDGGKKVFVTMKVPGHLKVGGVDPVDQYLAAVNSHDGSTKFTIMVTPVRIVCANTLNLAFRDHSNSFTARHTKNSTTALVGEARRMLDLSFDYLDGFQAEAERLINTTMTEIQFEEMVAAAFGPKEDGGAAARTRAERKVDEMLELFSDAYTQEGIRHTAWAGLNAITEWADHFSPVRGDQRDTTRAMKSVLDPAFKNEALRLVQAATV